MRVKAKEIYITDRDMERLRELLAVAHSFFYKGRTDLQQLAAELDRASVVDSKKIPKDVVTLNSRVQVTDIGTKEKMTYTLVFPRDANIDEGRISVLAPLGTAILGYRVGDEFDWEMPSGRRTLRIDKLLYQPEAEGNYDL